MKQRDFLSSPLLSSPLLSSLLTLVMAVGLASCINDSNEGIAEREGSSEGGGTDEEPDDSDEIVAPAVREVEQRWGQEIAAALREALDENGDRSAPWPEGVLGSSPTPQHGDEPVCDGDDCCPEDLDRVIVGTDGPDLIVTFEPACIVSLGGKDLVVDLGHGPPDAPRSVILAGADDDIVVTLAATRVIAGDGDDLVTALRKARGVHIEAGGGDDRVLTSCRAKEAHVEGGFGDDALRVLGHGATVTPGPDRDDTRVWRSTVIVNSPCELHPGERYRAHGQGSTLVAPVDLAALEGMGVTASGFDSFEEVTLDRSFECESECTLPCDRTPAEYVGLPDPTHWSIDPVTHTRYRRATQRELVANGWPQGASLVEAISLAADATTGAASIVLLVPEADGGARTVPLELYTADWAGTFVEERVVGTPPYSGTVTRVDEPTMYHYVPVGFSFSAVKPVDGAFLRVIGGTDGGILGTGVVDGVEVRVDGPNARWDLDVLPVSDGPIDVLPASSSNPIDENSLVKIERLALGEFGEREFDDCETWGLCPWLCSNVGWPPCEELPSDPGPGAGPKLHCDGGVDNDGDGAIDIGDEDCNHHPSQNCSHSNPEVKLQDWGCGSQPPQTYHYHRWEAGMSFALLGEARFCTKADLQDGNWRTVIYERGRQIEQLYNGTGVTDTWAGRTVRYVGGQCWIFETFADAEACSTNAAHCPAGYPYGGGDDVASFYYKRAWEAVQFSVGHWSGVFRAAQVLYDSEGYKDIPAKRLFVGSEAVAGLAPWDPDGLPEERRGESVADFFEEAPTSAHELGHNMWLDHPEVCSYPRSFMCESSGDGTELSDENETRLYDCLMDWECPRPSGYRYPEEQEPYCP